MDRPMALKRAPLSPPAPHGFQRTLLSAIFSAFVEAAATDWGCLPVVTQLDAQASTVRTLNEGETI
jgi:hypothetical protein